MGLVKKSVTWISIRLFAVLLNSNLPATLSSSLSEYALVLLVRADIQHHNILQPPNIEQRQDSFQVVNFFPSCYAFSRPTTGVVY
jgi:hypothetical protein